MSKITYRSDIDVLRAVSVIAVVIYHAFPALLPGGFVGVDVFFVISGYLITQIIMKDLELQRFSILDFYDRRIRRIFPVMLLVLWSALIIGWIVLYSEELKLLGIHTINVGLFIQNFGLVGESGYFDVDSHYKPLLHFWTLSVEEQFYVFWPILLLLAFRYSWARSYVLPLLVLVSFFWQLYSVRDYPEETFFHSFARFWELGVGSLLALWAHNHKPMFSQKIAWLVFSIGMLLILSAIIYLNKDYLYPSWWALLPVFGTALILIARVKHSRWYGCVYVGLISYSFYLWHWVVLSYLYIYTAGRPTTVMVLSAVGLSFILATLTHRYIERLRYVKWRYFSWALLLLGLCTIAAGISLYINKGFPDREHLAYLSQDNIDFIREDKRDIECNSYLQALLGERRKIDYCRSALTEPRRKKVAIVGDSHGHVMFRGFSEVAAENGYDTIVLANSNCPPLIGFKFGRNNKEVDWCQKKIQQIIDVLRKDSSIEMVLMVTRGPYFMHGDVKGKYTEESVKASAEHLYRKSTQNYKSYFSGFEKTLNEITNIKHINKLYYFLENPELDFEPKDMAPRPFDRWGISVLDGKMQLSLHQLRMSRYIAGVTEVVESTARAEIIDVSEYFCDSTYCYAFRGGAFLYADDDHFSISGSRFLARSVERMIFK